MIRFFTFLLLVVALRLCAVAEDRTTEQSAVIDVGMRRELFVEPTLIERLSGKAELRLHAPVPREVALEHNEPWEGNGCVYHSVFKDGDLYRMYYAAGQLTVTPNGVDAGTHGQSCCYAESDDGIHWRKPDWVCMNSREAPPTISSCCGRKSETRFRNRVNPPSSKTKIPPRHLRPATRHYFLRTDFPQITVVDCSRFSLPTDCTGPR